MGRPWIGPPIVGCWRHPERPCCACCAETLGFVDGNQIERENWVWGEDLLQNVLVTRHGPHQR